jgi:hypothetical protein
MADLTTNGPATKQATMDQVRPVPPHTFGPGDDAPAAKPLPNRKIMRRLVGVTGSTRSRDTQVAAHPLRTGRTVLSSLRSSNPRIRRSAKAAAIALGVLAAPTPKPAYRPAAPFATGTRRTREG